jgi:hypothetical protein
MLEMPIEELDLPMRAYNSLKRNNIVRVGQLLQLSDDELLRMRNFGKKSLDEMKERLRMRGFLLPDSDPTELDGLDEDGDEIEDEMVDELAPAAPPASRGGRRMTVDERPLEDGDEPFGGA